MLVRVEDKRWCGLIYRFNGELFIVVADVLNLRPREVDTRHRLIVLLVDVQSERCHAQPQLRVSLVLVKLSI